MKDPSVTGGIYYKLIICPLPQISLVFHIVHLWENIFPFSFFFAFFLPVQRERMRKTDRKIESLTHLPHLCFILGTLFLSTECWYGHINKQQKIKVTLWKYSTNVSQQKEVGGGSFFSNSLVVSSQTKEKNHIDTRL